MVGFAVSWYATCTGAHASLVPRHGRVLAWAPANIAPPRWHNTCVDTYHTNVDHKIWYVADGHPPYLVCTDGCSLPTPGHAFVGTPLGGPPFFEESIFPFLCKISSPTLS